MIEVEQLDTEQLRVKFPRKIESIHQIELTSVCNLRCVYCPSREIMANKHEDRKPMHMTEATFDRVMEWVAHYVRDGNQTELNLAGIGESTLHPKLAKFVCIARQVAGAGCKIVFATNGIEVTDFLAEELAPFKPEIWVSLHRPEKGLAAFSILKRHGIDARMSLDPAGDSISWAGQVKEAMESYGIPIMDRPKSCQWLRQGKAFVYSDGRIGACCLDATGAGVMGHIDQPIGSVTLKPYKLCQSCHLEIGVIGFDQRRKS